MTYLSDLELKKTYYVTSKLFPDYCAIPNFTRQLGIGISLDAFKL